MCPDRLIRVHLGVFWCRKPNGTNSTQGSEQLVGEVDRGQMGKMIANLASENVVKADW